MPKLAQTKSKQGCVRCKSRKVKVWKLSRLLWRVRLMVLKRVRYSAMRHIRPVERVLDTMCSASIPCRQVGYLSLLHEATKVSKQFYLTNVSSIELHGPTSHRRLVLLPDLTKKASPPY